MTTVWVMLIWVAGATGGPATITGFENSRACSEATANVKAGFTAINHPPGLAAGWVGTICIEVKKRSD